MSMQKCLLVNWSNLFYPTPLPPSILPLLPSSSFSSYVHVHQSHTYSFTCPSAHSFARLSTYQSNYTLSPYTHPSTFSILHPSIFPSLPPPFTLSLLHSLPPSLSPSPCITTDAIFKRESRTQVVL